MKMMKVASLVLGMLLVASDAEDVKFPFKNPPGSKFGDGTAVLSSWSGFEMHCYHFLWTSVGDPSKTSTEKISKSIRQLCVKDSDTCDSLTAGIMNAVEAKMSKSRKRPYNDWCQAVFQKEGGELPTRAVELADKEDAKSPAPQKQQPLLKANARQPEADKAPAKSVPIKEAARARAQARAHQTGDEAHVTQSALRKAIDQTADISGGAIATGIEGVAIAEGAANAANSGAVSSEMDSAENSLDKALGAAKKMSKKHRRHRHV